MKKNKENPVNIGRAKSQGKNDEESARNACDLSCEKLDPAVQCYMLHVMTSVMCRCDAAVVR